MKKQEKIEIKSMILVGMFAAMLAVLSQIAIPMPSGVPITMQTFAVVLTGVVLGGKNGIMATAVYILLGAIGLPVFAGFSGGLGILAGSTGGFFWGFLALVWFSGVGTSGGKRWSTPFYGLAGLVICHLLGILQFMLVMQMGFMESAILVSVPYLLKDAISIVLAYGIGTVLRTRLNASNLLSYAKNA